MAEVYPGSNLHVFWRDAQGRQRSRTLSHKDRDRAKEEAEVIANGLAEPESEAAPAEDLTLGKLLDLYFAHGLVGRSEKYQKEQRRKLRMMERFFGRSREVVSLSKSDVDAYAHARRTGRFGPKRTKGKSVRLGTVWCDLTSLNIALNWATQHRTKGGRPLLQGNPWQHISFPREPSPRRPVAGEPRYRALQGVAHKLDWRFELALDLAWATGHRIGAICKLRWSDVDFESSPNAPHGRIRWAAEFDKMGHEHITPMNRLAHEALVRARKESDVIPLHPELKDAWVLPAVTDASRPISRTLLNEWLGKAEGEAEIEHIDGVGWHAFRRGWATQRKHFPLVDVAEAGGWKDTKTLHRIYQQADPETVYAVVSEGAKAESGGS